MSKHTPGPWTLFQQNGGVIAIKSPEDRVVAHLQNRNSSGSKFERHEANARLIAAAPDLLEVIQMALEAPIDDRSWEDDAIEAIKKADPFWVNPLIN